MQKILKNTGEKIRAFLSEFKISVFKSAPVRASLRCSGGVKGGRVGENSLKKIPTLEPQLLILSQCGFSA